MLGYKYEADYDVSSHAASFLVMLASTGPSHWRLEDVAWEVILQEVDDVIKLWDIDKPKGVKFRCVICSVILRQSKR